MKAKEECKCTKEEKVTFRVRTFANGEVWADTSYGTRKSGAVGKDTFDAIANCAKWIRKMSAMRHKDEAVKAVTAKKPVKKAKKERK